MKKCQQGSIRISHIRLNTVYYETNALLSRIKPLIYNKDKQNLVKLIISYKSVMDSNTFFFGPFGPKIGHSLVSQDKFVSMYVQAVFQ